MAMAIRAPDNTVIASPMCLPDPTVTSGASRDIGLRVTAIFVILVGSTAAALLPVFLVARHHRSSAPQTQLRVLFLSAKHFGAGVILGTAFIHLLAPGMQALSNDCLPGGWKEYPYAMGLCLLSILSVFMVQVIALRVEAKARMGIGAQIIGLAILECGAVLHSVLIGLTLAAAPKFKTLFVVLLLHQIFEGVGIGSRLASVEFSAHPVSFPVIGAVVFGLSTPVGVAIGLATGAKSEERSSNALIVSGVLDCLSAGILIYTALVELMARDLLADETLLRGSWKELALVLFLLLSGCGVMALLGKWA